MQHWTGSYGSFASVRRTLRMLRIFLFVAAFGAVVVIGLSLRPSRGESATSTPATTPVPYVLGGVMLAAVVLTRTTIRRQTRQRPARITLSGTTLEIEGDQFSERFDVRNARLSFAVVGTSTITIDGSDVGVPGSVQRLLLTIPERYEQRRDHFSNTRPQVGYLRLDGVSFNELCAALQSGGAHDAVPVPIATVHAGAPASTARADAASTAEIDLPRVFGRGISKYFVVPLFGLSSGISGRLFELVGVSRTVGFSSPSFLAGSAVGVAMTLLYLRTGWYDYSLLFADGEVVVFNRATGAARMRVPLARLRVYRRNAVGRNPSQALTIRLAWWRVITVASMNGRHWQRTDRGKAWWVMYLVNPNEFERLCMLLDVH